MATIPEALSYAVQCLQAGRLQEAEETCVNILQAKSDEAQAWHLLGVIAYQVGKPEMAVERIGRAIALQPELAEAHCNLGNALKEQGKLDEAIACYRRALELKPNLVEARSNLGLALQRQGKLEEAIAWYSRALELEPGSVETHFSLGTAFKAQAKLEEAVACYHRALELRPDFLEALINLGNVLLHQRKHAEAIDCYQRGLELKPDSAEAHNNLGNAFKDQGRLDEAALSYRRAIELKPGFTEAHSNLGKTLKDQGKLDEALACYRRAVDLRPGFAEAHSNLLFLLHFVPTYNAAAIGEECRLWNERYAEPLAKLIRPHANDSTSERHLRVGYVSPDFREHCQAFFTVPLLSSHDHQQIEIVCYSDVARPDGITERLRSYIDGWRDISGLGDDQVAELIREDQIDILVDLTMHMPAGRPLLFARKPAPVQVCWLAYPGTTGLSAIDYRLTDPYLDPPGLFDRFYAEESLRLPDTFWCYDPLTSEPEVSRLPALKNGYVTFGNLNSFCKINAGVLELWAQVMKEVERSRLVLLAPEGSCRQWVREVLGQEGIGEERIELVGWQPRRQYLETYQRIDIMLDTLPYNGHTTSLDALWMGVPVVTIVGQTVVGRAGVSQLNNLGLPELIADGPDEFVRIAAELAGDLERLSQLRATLRQRMQKSPLMDRPRFARNIEAAYRSMWQRWCAASKSSSSTPR